MRETVRYSGHKNQEKEGTEKKPFRPKEPRRSTNIFKQKKAKKNRQKNKNKEEQTEKKPE